MKRVLHEELKEKFGSITKSTVIGNMSLMYTLEIETDTGRWIVQTGGTSKAFESFKYDPRSIDWADHIRVGIISIERKKTMRNM